MCAGDWKGDPVLSDAGVCVTVSVVCRKGEGMDPELRACSTEVKGVGLFVLLLGGRVGV